MEVIKEEAEACNDIVRLIHERCCLRLHERMQSFIRTRLRKRLQATQCRSLAQYCQLLQHGPDPGEWVHAVDALTTNYTRFMREEEHFQFMVHTALPALMASGRRPIRIWSAGCASGEEPYTIAFHLAETFPIRSGWDWSIVASDVSTRALAVAKRGIYSQNRIKAIPPLWQRKYLQMGIRDSAGYYRVKPTLMERVEFLRINLATPSRFSEPFGIIFCRNVMIYFDRGSRESLVQELGRHLTPQGYLLIGHSESLAGLDVPFMCLRPSVYQKAA